MSNLPEKHRPFTMSIAEGSDYIYWRFDHEKPSRYVAWDVLLWVCKEMMDFMSYTEFSKLTRETKADIVSIIIKQKKEDWTYTEFEKPYTYDYDEED